MSGMPHGWLWTITHPTKHLVGTVAISAIIIAATILSVNFPQWAAVLFVIALISGLTWYVLMMRAYRRHRRPIDGRSRE